MHRHTFGSKQSILYYRGDMFEESYSMSLSLTMLLYTDLYTCRTS